MRKWVICLYLINVLCFIQKSYCQREITKELSVTLSQHYSQKALFKEIQIGEDSSGFLALKNVLTQVDFIPAPSSKPNFGYTESAYWCRFRLQNTSRVQSIHWLEVQYAIMDSISLYELDSSNSIIQMRIGGDALPFSAREIRDANVVFPITLKPSETKSIYLRFKTEGTMTFPLVLWQPQAFAEKTAQSRFGFGIYYGIIVVMLFYNLFIFFSLRDRTYLYYVFTITAIALFQLAFNGYGFEYIWGNYPSFNEIAIPFFISILSLSSLLFARKFLRIADFIPKTDRLILLYIGLVCLEMLLLFLLPYKITIKVTSIIGAIGTMILLFLGAASYYKGNRSALYFLLAWGLFLIGVLTQILRGFGVIENTFFTAYAMQIGSALEVIFLALGLADRINILKKELAEKAIQEQKQKVAYEIAQRTLIESQKQQLEKLVQERTQDLEQKTEELQIQNQKMKDSINYAKRIQDAILPPQQQLKEILGEHFVFFQPKDIVSGDFYWLSQIGQKTIIAAVDCTGHGVPGAFMSIIGNDLLNQIVNERRITNPTLILESLDEGVRTMLKQHEDTDIRSSSRDGMDIALCVIDKENHMLEFAGANRPLLLVKNQQLEEIKGDRTPIGGWVNKRENSFTTHQIPLNGKMNVYLSSDGYQDQFGENGKKFLTKNFKKLLIDISTKNFYTQHQQLQQVMAEFQGSEPQIDDVLVIGFTVSKG